MRFSFMKKETENHFQRSVNENKGKEPRGQRFVNMLGNLNMNANLRAYY